MPRPLALLFASLLVACGGSSAPPAPPAPKAPAPVDAPVPGLPGGAPQACSADTDCVLRPALHCCGDCAPSPPFQAVTRAELEAERKRHDGECAVEDHDCSQHTCVPKPAGCRARASCVEGRCSVIAEGC